MLKNLIKASFLISLFLIFPKIGNCLTDTIAGEISTSYSASLSSTLLEQKPEVCGNAQTASMLIGSTPNTSCSYDSYGGGSCTTVISETYEDMVFTNCLQESIYEDCNLSCSHVNNYNYSFLYEISQNNIWNALANTEAHKCEDVRVRFTPIADWGANLGKSCQQRNDPRNYTKTISITTRTSTVTVPPTDILNCSGQENCLSQATESQLNTETSGKGAQQVPADWVNTTQNSLTGQDEFLSCSNGICEAYESGDYSLSATAPGSIYYGQCRGYDMTVNTPGANIGAVTSNVTAEIINRPPTGTITIANSNPMPEEEVQVICKVEDPDCQNDPAHIDKISKVRWICTDSDGNSDNCFMWKSGVGIFTKGGFTEEIIASERSNSYTSTALFKATANGNYIITCEAWDDDANTSKSGIVGTIGAGVVPSYSNYCAVISEDGGSSNTICNENEEAKYEAYYSGLTPVKYRWKCFQNDSVKESTSPNITCTYDQANTYIPSLSIIGNDGKETQCVSQTSTIITKEGKCKVEVAKKGSGEYKSEIDIASGEQVNARINKECVESGGSTTWEFINGSTDKKDNNTATEINFNASALNGQVKAQITNSDGSIIPCNEAKVIIDTKEKIQWGN